MKSLTISALILMCLSTGKVAAGSLQVNVSGLAGGAGQIGCGLHTSGANFPMGHTGVKTVWVKPSGTTATCIFKDVAPGTYAVAVAHDLNGNRKTDTNVLGLPTEAWGVSRNVRPALRAPRFNEAAFQIGDGTVAVDIEVK